VEWHRPEPLERRFGICLRVERKRGLVLRKSMTIGKFGVALLQMPAVIQEKTT
jgi:hypothetical protein